MNEEVVITGPHGMRENKPFFFIYQSEETEPLNRYFQTLYWRTKGYEVFMTCLAGYLIATRRAPIHLA